METAFINLTVQQAFAFTALLSFQWPFKVGLSYPFYRREKQGSGRLTNLTKVKQLLSRFMTAGRWGCNLGNSQRKELFKGGLGGKRHLSCGKPDKHQSTCDVDTHHPAPKKRHCTLRTTIWNCFSLVLPFVQSLFSLFQKPYECQLGAFWIINAFLAVDLKTNLVHYSRNLSKQMLRFCFYKYQTVPSTYMSMKPNFCCLLCTKHSPSTGHRQASLPKAYRATGNRDKTLAIHRFRKGEPLGRKLE